MKPRINVLTIGVDNLEKSLAFYRDALGLKAAIEELQVQNRVEFDGKPAADAWVPATSDTVRAWRLEHDAPYRLDGTTAGLVERRRGTEVFAVDPLTIRAHFEVDYLHCYKQDTPFFHGLAKHKLLGSHCPKCNYRFATPRVHCMYCGQPTQWFELPGEGRVHSWTVCYFAAQEFLKDVPFTLVLVEFDGVDTLFMTRLVGIEKPQIGMPVRVAAEKTEMEGLAGGTDAIEQKKQAVRQGHGIAFVIGSQPRHPIQPVFGSIGRLSGLEEAVAPGQRLDGLRRLVRDERVESLVLKQWKQLGRMPLL